MGRGSRQAELVELANHIALITGGTAGIGWESARLLAAEGAAVIISGRDRERGEMAAGRIGANARFVQADLADMDAVRSLVQQCENTSISS
jgi:NAD(P)-dependent dehydrogenase (short-subunit alcohol dehydrogenase family)